MGAMADGNIHMPEELLADDVAQQAVERYLRQTRRERLYVYGDEQARKFGIREEDVPGFVADAGAISDEYRRAQGDAHGIR
jgi:hypothetical protein